MAVSTARSLDNALVWQQRSRAIEHGRSARAEDQEIRRIALSGSPAARRQEAADRLAAFRQRTAGRGGATASELLTEARAGRLHSLARWACNVLRPPAVAESS